MTYELKKLTLESDDISRVEAINKASFPDEEYVSIKNILSLEHGMQTEVLGIYSEAGLVGFFGMLVYSKSAYVSYFAVDERLRGQGVGSAALKLLKERYFDKQIVIDFEAVDDASENNEQRIRRRHFYLRNGYIPTGYFMFYMENEFELTSSVSEFDLEDFKKIINKLHNAVNEFDPKLYKK